MLINAEVTLLSARKRSSVQTIYLETVRRSRQQGGRTDKTYLLFKNCVNLDPSGRDGGGDSKIVQQVLIKIEKGNWEVGSMAGEMM